MHRNRRTQCRGKPLDDQEMGPSKGEDRQYLKRITKADHAHNASSFQRQGEITSSQTRHSIYLGSPADASFLTSHCCSHILLYDFQFTISIVYSSSFISPALPIYSSTFHPHRMSDAPAPVLPEVPVLPKVGSEPTVHGHR
jgi:hypothetical protein